MTQTSKRGTSVVETVIGERVCECGTVYMTKLSLLSLRGGGNRVLWHSVYNEPTGSYKIINGTGTWKCVGCGVQLQEKAEEYNKQDPASG